MALLASYAFNEGSGTTAAEADGGPAITGIPGWDASGRHGAGLRLNLARVSLTPFAVSTAFTIMADVYIFAAGGNNYTMVFNSTTVGTVQQSGTGGLEWYPYGAIQVSGSLPFLTWKHVAIAADGSTRKLFVDGVQIESVSSPALSGTDPLWLGGNEIGYEPNIEMDNLRIYNTALSQPEIAALAGTAVSPLIQDEGTKYDSAMRAMTRVGRF